MENRRYQNRSRPYNNGRNRLRRYFTLEPKAGQRNGRNGNAFGASAPIGYRTLENVLRIDGDAELILKLSSERNGFLLLLE